MGKHLYTFDTSHIWLERHFFDKGVKLHRRKHSWPLRVKFRARRLRQTNRFHKLKGNRATCCGYWEADKIPKFRKKAWKRQKKYFKAIRNEKKRYKKKP